MISSVQTLTDEKNWFLVRCKSKQEQRASINLANQLITSYYPTVDVIKMVRGKKQTKQEALFPGYLFVHLDISSFLASKVKNTLGVYGFVNFAGKPQLVPSELVMEIRTLEKQTIDLTMKSGDKVTLNDSQYENITAIFLEAECEKRSLLLIEVLNQQVTLSIDNKAIAPVAS